MKNLLSVLVLLIPSWCYAGHGGGHSAPHQHCNPINRSYGGFRYGYNPGYNFYRGNCNNGFDLYQSYYPIVPIIVPINPAPPVDPNEKYDPNTGIWYYFMNNQWYYWTGQNWQPIPPHP